jgi:hypothetical protein
VVGERYKNPTRQQILWGLFKSNPNKGEGRVRRDFSGAIELIISLGVVIGLAITVVSHQYNLRKKFEKSDVDYSLGDYTREGGEVTGASGCTGS